jgi:hypothetical protein
VLDASGKVWIYEKRPGYPVMQLVFRGMSHFEMWLDLHLDRDGVWVGKQPDR